MPYQAPASRIVTPFFTKERDITDKTITDKFYDRIVQWLFDNHDIDCDGANWRFLPDTKQAYIVLNGGYLTFDTSPCYDTEDKCIGVYQIEICLFPKEHPAHQDPWWEYHPCHEEIMAGNQGIEILSLTHPDAIKAYLAGWDNYINQLGWDWDEECIPDEEYDQKKEEYGRIKDYYSPSLAG